MTTPEHSQDLEAAPAPLTAPASLQLATPAALVEGLALLGLLWEPEPWSPEARDGAPGMYAWVMPTRPDDLMHCPAIYIGTGAGVKGWRGRVRDEEGWRTGDHAHGIAIRRTEAKVVGGQVHVTVPDLAWLTGTIADVGIKSLKPYVDDEVARKPLLAAEAIAIRMSLHLGDVGAPVNSTHGGAWNQSSGHDWAGYAAARRLRMLRGADLQ